MDRTFRISRVSVACQLGSIRWQRIFNNVSIHNVSIHNVSIHRTQPQRVPMTMSLGVWNSIWTKEWRSEEN
jgi:hypothetical protein